MWKADLKRKESFHLQMVPQRTVVARLDQAGSRNLELYHSSQCSGPHLLARGVLAGAGSEVREQTWSSTWMWCWCWRPGLTHCATVLVLLSVLEHDGCPSGLKENSSRLQPFPKASSSLSTALLPSSLSLKRVFDSKSWTSGFGIWFGNVAHEVVGKCPSSVSWEALLPGLQWGCFPLLCWTH